jgi:hypothetical protein
MIPYLYTMKKWTLAGLFFVVVLTGQAQVHIWPELCAGYGLNPGLELYDEAVIHPNGFVSEGGLQAEFMLFGQKKFSLLTGLHVRYIRNAGQSATSSFVAHTSRGVFSALAGYTIGNWKMSLGASVQNNRDLNEFLTDQEYNYRFNALARVDYLLAPRWQAGARYSHALSQVGDSYFVLDPQYSLMIGMSFLLNGPAEE